MTAPKAQPGAEARPSALEDSTVKEARDSTGPEVRVAQEYLFVALEADRPRSGGARYSLDGVTEVVIARGETRAAHREPAQAGPGAGAAAGAVARTRLVLRLPGRSLSSRHARLSRTPEGWVLIDERSTNGSYVNGQRTERQLVTSQDVIEVGHSFLLVRSYPRRVDQPATDLDAGGAAPESVGFVTLVPPLGERLAELQRVARSPLPVVLTGPTGTGKEVLARGIHALSGRSGRFVALNCGALTKTLAESELFGHVKGSFSGAVADAPGFVRSAHGGTLLLDELADLDRAIQPTLLRVLQEREVVPVGSARPQRVDVRFIATSPRPLEELVDRGELRADLHARLSAFTYAAPPLCERREDLGVLIAPLLAKHEATAATAVRFAPDAGLRLLQHAWPLNVRELEQALLRGMALAVDGVIDTAHMALAGAARKDAKATARSEDAGATEARLLSPEDQRLRQQLVSALADAGGNIAEVARQMGKARMQVHRWMKRLAIDPDSYRR